MSEIKKKINNHYDAIANQYHKQYEKDKLYDLSAAYPGNYFRLQLLLNSFISKRIKRVIEVGVGEGTPLSTIGKAGIDVWGFDFSTEMVKKSKERKSIHEGICEGCGNQDLLYKINGTLICESCKDMQE